MTFIGRSNPTRAASRSHTLESRITAGHTTVSARSSSHAARIWRVLPNPGGSARYDPSRSASQEAPSSWAGERCLVSMVLLCVPAAPGSVLLGLVGFGRAGGVEDLVPTFGVTRAGSEGGAHHLLRGDVGEASELELRLRGPGAGALA